MDKFNISVGAHNSLDDTVWSTTTGGTNDTTAPGVLDKAIFDANSLGACTWNTPSVLDVDMQVGIVSTIVQSVDFICLNGFDQDAGSWTASGFKFQVNGQRNGITPAIFIQDSSAGSSMYIGLGIDYRSTQTGNAWDSNDIIYGFGNQGVTFEMRNDDFKTRHNRKFTPDNIYKMTGRNYMDVCKAAGGTYTITDNGAQQQITDCNFDQMDEINFVTTALNRVRLTLDGDQFDGNVDLGGAQIDSGVAFDLFAGNIWINGGQFNQWISGGPAVGNIRGILLCESMNVGSAALTTRNGQLIITGSLFTTNATTVYEADFVGENKLDVSGADAFETGSLLVETLGDIDLGGITIPCNGAFDISATANSASAGATIIRRGSDDGTFKLGGLTDIAIVVQMSAGGICRMDEAWSVNNHKEAAVGDSEVIWLSGAIFAVVNPIQTLGSTNAVTENNPSVAATTYQITVPADIGPVNRYSRWSYCNISGAFIRVDTITGGDDGGNDVTDPNGIDFDSFPLDQPGLGRTRKIGAANLNPNISKVKTL